MSRVKEIHVPTTLVFAAAALTGLLLTLALHTSGVELGLNLTIVGLVMALLLPLGLEIRTRASRTRRVIILDYRSHQYGHAVARGVMRTLNADSRPWMVEYKSPNAATTDGSLPWQVRELQTAVIEDVDGVVLIPAADDRDLWFPMAAAIKSGVFAVVVDTKPPNHLFRNVGIEPPRFVSARYDQSGVLIGDLLARWLHEDSTRKCVLWTGPAGSYAGEERTRNILYRLAIAGYLERTHLIPMTEWAPSPERCAETVKVIENSAAEVAVYAADDENAMTLHWLVVSERPKMRSRMFIVGCNATPDDWGEVPSVALRTLEATVDILAEEQGAQAALLMIKERNGKLSPSERSVFIAPSLCYPDDAQRMWVESLFPGQERDEDGPKTVQTITLDEEGKMRRMLVEEPSDD